MRRLVVTVSSLLLLESAFYSVLAPLLPGLVARFDVGDTEAGILVAAPAAGVAVGAGASAWLARRYGSRETTAVGLGLLAVATVAFALAQGYALLVAARFVQGLAGAVIWTGGLAWLAAGVPTRRRTEAVGLAFGVAEAGMLIGPAVGAVAAHAGRGLVFTVLALVAVAALVAVLAQPRAPRTPRGGHGSLLSAARRPGVAASAGLVAVPSLYFGLVGVVAPLRLDALGLGPTAIGTVFTGGAVIGVFALPLAGRWASRRGSAAPVRILLPVAALLALAVPYAGSVWSFVATLVAAWIAFDLVWVPLLARLSERTEQAGHEPALGYALMNVALGPSYALGAAAGPALAGATARVVPFAVVALACLAALRPEPGRRPRADRRGAGRPASSRPR